MNPKDIDKFIEEWIEGQERVFYYYEYWLDEEILTIKKINNGLYEINRNKSTVNAGHWDNTNMRKILGREGLVFKRVGTYMEYWKKGNGCECGAWRTLNPDCHVDYCPKYRKF